MPTVTSYNKDEFVRDEMAKKQMPSSEQKMSDPASYKYFAKEGENLSKNAETSMEHFSAMGAHKHAAMFAKPHPVHKEHEEKAKFHAAEHRTMRRLEQERYVKEREENARKANTRFNKAKGNLASSDEEKRTGYSDY